LRVLPNIGNFQTGDQLTANPIIIVDNLLKNYFMSNLSYAVDGANNKWIGTADSGFFFVSPNGQETSIILR
jgi:hypothetical protein